MRRADFLPARMNALWFTYVALFLFSLMPNWGLYLDMFEIAAVSGFWLVLVNLWSWYSGRPIIDERKQQIATEAMAWGFVVVSLALIPAGTTGIELNPDLIRSTAELGLWAWLIVFSLKNLVQLRGGSDE
ncbi:hypothetical protein [Candidatus Nanohalococcus occultus]|uniref:hypothetical protein n=1 Tax=Candidatus Nanohalococcus occultus TaxID=2978047 RepID=UPI0039DFA05C